MAGQKFFHALLAMLAATLCAVPASVSTAQMGNPYFPYRCWNGSKAIVRPTTGAPNLINATLARLPALGFRVCEDNEGNEHYKLVTRDLEPNGICVMHAIEVFSPHDPAVVDDKEFEPQKAIDQVDWLHPPAPWRATPLPGQKSESLRIDGKLFPIEPDVEMADSNSTCPAVDSDEYAQIRNMTEVEFKRINSYWRNRTSTLTAFDEMLSQLSSACEPGVDIRWLKDREFRNVTNAIRSEILGARYNIRIHSLSRSRNISAIVVTERGQMYDATFTESGGSFRVACLGGVWIP